MIQDSTYVQGLVDYINDIKPYSSKLTDVATEYLFYDAMDVKVTDSHYITAHLNSIWTLDFNYNGSRLIYQLPMNGLSSDVAFNFSNYNILGAASYNSVGAVWNNSSQFVLTTQVQDGNNISFYDNTSIVTGTQLDHWGNTVLKVEPEAGRTGQLIGTLAKINNATPYYIFEFSKVYLDTFASLDTGIQIVVAQKTGTCDTVNVAFTEATQWVIAENIDKVLRVHSSNDDTDDNRDKGSSYDTTQYDDVYGYDGPSIDSLIAAATVFEKLVVRSITQEGYITEIVSISKPNTTTLDTFVYDTHQVSELIINHFMGDPDPAGPHASTGGVEVFAEVLPPINADITTYVPVLIVPAPTISNPYINNVPKLFNTTKIVFGSPTDCRIRITKP